MTTMNTQIMNAVFFANHKIYLPSEKKNSLGDNAKRALEICLTVEPSGFVLSKDLIMALSHMSDSEINIYGKDIVDVIFTSVGHNRAFTPMYPNFPNQVIEASDTELLINACMHYFGDWLGIRILPKYEKIKREVLEKFPKPKVIDLCTDEDLKVMFKNMVGANVAYSVSQREGLELIAGKLNTQGVLVETLNQSDIPNKENLAFWGNFYIELFGVDGFRQVMLNKFQTATDVLRLVAAYSKQDTSLAKFERVGNLPRSMRKLILDLLEMVIKTSSDKEQVMENLLTYRSEWVRIAHACHIGEFGAKYQYVVVALNKLRNNEKIHTFNSLVEKKYEEKSANTLIELLSVRPGVFARHLTRLLNEIQPVKGVKVKNFTDAEKGMFVDAFLKVAHKVSTPVLLQLYSHFKNIEYKSNLSGRAIMPKGGLSKIFYQEGKIGVFDDLLCMQIVKGVKETLESRFAKLPALGNVFISDELKYQNVPFAQRSASKALKTVARGSSFPVEDCENLRLFIYWKEGDSRCDIDLSGSTYDKDFNFVDHCGYWNLRGDAFTHSGDLTSAPNGASEFIDVNLSKLKSNVAYVAMTLTVYTGQKFFDIPECFAGWMERGADAQKGEVFDARTVKNKIDLTADKTSIVSIIYDVKNNRMIWADMAYGKNAMASNAAIDSNGIGMIVRSLVETRKPTLHELFTMHAKARGTIVDSPEKADVIFDIHNGITPFDFDVITGEYMKDDE